MRYTFDNYLRDINVLYDKIVKSGVKYDLIVGIKRGGLVPAVHLSNLLGVPMQSLSWSTKGIRDSSNPHLITSKDKNVLLVDDIIDEGHTIKEIHDTYWKMDTAVLIYNCINRYSLVPTYAAWTINREELPQWIDYWWEKLT